MQIAFATCRALKILTADDQLAVEPLWKHGISVDPVSWDDHSADWSKYKAVILRTTWDYHRRLPEFLNWVNDLEKQRIPIWNSAAVIRKNVIKRYLIDLQNAGIPIVSTMWIPKGTKTNLRNILNGHGWSAAIIKPDVSASAYRTWYTDVHLATKLQQNLDEILADTGALIQEFRNEINSGEWSLIFFQSKFSHAVIKLPAPGDFRVQEELGGIVEAALPPELLIHQAEKILEQIEGPILYARVDGIVSKDQFLLMELELIEPSLFLGSSPTAPEVFAKSISNLLTAKANEDFKI
jgi:glutathione synthase/RimK-type ligase-like ATP-grasp enzyme